MATGEPKIFRAPATSRKASSTDSGSTRGVNSWKIAMMRAETSPYRPFEWGRMMRFGHRRFARATGIAEFTP